MKHTTSWVTALLLVLATGCKPEAAGSGGLAGKVTETMNAGGYTYVFVDAGTNKFWAAASPFSVKPGDTVSLSEAMPMENFHSKSLNRDFPVIYFASRIAVNGDASGAKTSPAGPPAVSGDLTAGLPPGHPPLGGTPAASKADFSGLTRVPGGKTIAEVYADSSTLEGKSVKVRGKVVKYNANIMGKNWVHIQDGTGTAGSDDLLVTTAGQTKRGDTVLVEGRVTLNKDFGAGYKYNLLLEDAQVTVE